MRILRATGLPVAVTTTGGGRITVALKKGNRTLVKKTGTRSLTTTLRSKTAKRGALRLTVTAAGKTASSTITVTS